MSAPTVEVITGRRRASPSVRHAVVVVDGVQVHSSRSSAAARTWRDGFIAGAAGEPGVCPNGFGKVRVLAWFAGHAAGKAWRSREGEQA